MANVSKDLTEALRAMMEQGDSATNVVPKPRGSAPAVESSALLGASPAAKSGGSDLAAGGTKTIMSSDGLFTLVFPDVLKATIAGSEYTIPVIKKVTP